MNKWKKHDRQIIYSLEAEPCLKVNFKIEYLAGSIPTVDKRSAIDMALRSISTELNTVINIYNKEAQDEDTV